MTLALNIIQIISEMFLNEEMSVQDIEQKVNQGDEL